MKTHQKKIFIICVIAFSISLFAMGLRISKLNQKVNIMAINQKSQMRLNNALIKVDSLQNQLDIIQDKFIIQNVKINHEISI